MNGYIENFYWQKVLGKIGLKFGKEKGIKEEIIKMEVFIMENIIKIFNSEDEKEIKQSFKGILIERFKEDLESMDVYLFSPDKIEDAINEAIEELIEELINEFKLEYKNKLKEYMDKKFEELASVFS